MKGKCKMKGEKESRKEKKVGKVMDGWVERKYEGKEIKKGMDGSKEKSMNEGKIQKGESMHERGGKYMGKYKNRFQILCWGIVLGYKLEIENVRKLQNLQKQPIITNLNSNNDMSLSIRVQEKREFC